MGYDTQDVAYRSALHMIPLERRMTFGDEHKIYTRLKAMKVAKEQALVREGAADYVKRGKEVPGDLMNKYEKILDIKLGGARRRQMQSRRPPSPRQNDSTKGGHPSPSTSNAALPPRPTQSTAQQPVAQPMPQPPPPPHQTTQPAVQAPPLPLPPPAGPSPQMHFEHARPRQEAGHVNVSDSRNGPEPWTASEMRSLSTGPSHSPGGSIACIPTGGSSVRDSSPVPIINTEMPVTGVSMSVAPARTTGQRGVSPVQLQDQRSQQLVPFLEQGHGGLQTPPSVSGNAWRPVPHVEKPGIPPGQVTGIYDQVKPQGPRPYLTSHVPATYGQHASIVHHQWAYNQPGTGQTYMRPKG